MVDQQIVKLNYLRQTESVPGRVRVDADIVHAKQAFEDKAKIQEACAAVHTAFEPHAITPQLAPHGLAEGHAWAKDRGKALQRAASAVEGRNGLLSPMHHQQRGLPKQRDKV